MSGNRNILRGVLDAAMGFLRATAKAAYSHGFLREPHHIGYEEGELLPPPERTPKLIFPNAPRVPRMTFPALGWNVGAQGPNVPGPGRAQQLAGELVDYEWAILREANGQDPGQRIIEGAAYNECSEFLRKAGATDLMGKATQLGKDVLALDPKRMDVV